MNLFGYYSLLMSVGINGAPKSDSDPVKRIQTLVSLFWLKLINTFVENLAPFWPIPEVKKSKEKRKHHFLQKNFLGNYGFY